MNWKTQDGEILKIKEMSTSHLLNCRSLLEKGNRAINTLSVDASVYSETRFEQISYKDDWQHVFVNSGRIQEVSPNNIYDYSKSPEYLNIVKELKIRGF